MHVEYEKLTEGQKLLVRGMFHPTKRGYEAYIYEITQGGWVLSRRKRKPGCQVPNEKLSHAAGDRGVASGKNT